MAFVRRCPDHGPLVGVRYCPECASSGRSWTEAQAVEADIMTRPDPVRTAAEQVVLEWCSPAAGGRAVDPYGARLADLIEAFARQQRAEAIAALRAERGAEGWEPPRVDLSFDRLFVSGPDRDKEYEFCMTGCDEGSHSVWLSVEQARQLATALLPPPPAASSGESEG